MGKVVSRQPDTMSGEGPPLYNRETQLYPHVGIGQAPPRTESQTLKDYERGVEFVNYNWAMAKTIGLLRDKRLDRLQAYDVLKKARELFVLSYAQVYGKAPVVPEVRVNGKDS